MRNGLWLGAILCVGLAAAGGCKAPVITVTHVLPAAVPIAADVGRLEVGDFTVRGEPNEEAAAFTARALRERLAELKGASLSQPSGETTAGADAAAAGDPDASGPTARVSGEIRLTVTDTEVQRPIRRWDPDSREARTLIAPSLVRQVQVTVEFVVHRDATFSPLATAEVRRSYDSRNDPAVWGPLGLGRPDDPAGVPETDEIVRNLLTECVEAFVEMIRPLEVRVEVPLRWTSGGDVAVGLDAAGQGAFAEAAEYFRAEALKREKNVNLLFDVAAAAEGAGDLKTALEYYRKVATLTKDKDALAVEGAERVQRVMRRLGNRRP